MPRESGRPARTRGGRGRDTAQRSSRNRTENPDLERAALLYAKRGWHVFPLKPGTKQPHPKLAPHGLKDATTDADVIRGWWKKSPTANVGIATGRASGLVVIDLDTGADPSSLHLPITRKVKTPSGGAHLYFAHPGADVRNSAGRLGPKIDVRGDGGYVVAPPSVFAARQYKLVKKATLARWPTTLVPSVDTPSAATPGAGSLTPGSRHEALVSLAGRLRRDGLAAEDIEPVLQAFNSAACDPPKPKSEVRRLARDIATRYSPEETDVEDKIRQRVERLEVDEEARRRVESKRAGARFEFPAAGRTLADDLAEPRAHQKYTVADLHTTGGNTLLVAQLKTGKTTLALNLIAALADREPFLGVYGVSELSGRIAWWNYELSPDMAREWIDAVGIRNQDRVAAPLHVRGVHLPFWRDDFAEATVKWLRDNEIEFWILDPAARAWRGLVDNENDNSQLAAFTDTLDQIKREAGVTDVVLPTHMGRAESEEGAERSRGGTRLEDWMDHGWYLTRGGKAVDAPRFLRAMGRDVEVEAVELVYDDATRRLRSTGRSRLEHRRDEGALRVISALMRLGEPVTTSTLKEELGGGNKDKDPAMKAARAKGWARRIYEDGSPVDEASPRSGVTMLYEITDEGRRANAPLIKLKGGSKDG